MEDFSKFYLKLDIKPKSLEQRIILFTGYLIDQKKKSSTVHSYVSAIKSTLQMEGFEINENQYLLSSLTKACHFKNDRATIKRPIQMKTLRILLRSTENYFLEMNQPYLSILYQAIFVKCYYGLFRIGEVTSGSHPVLVNDVEIGTNKNKLKFTLKSSKTHCIGDPPQIVKIASDKQGKQYDSQFCPFDILRRYLAQRKPYKSEKEPFFVFRDRSPVTPANVWKVFKVLLKINNYSLKEFSLHGFRSGRAVDLLKAGVSVETIKKLGRWKSNCVYRYLKC